jgi:hypothetical protein
MFWPHERIVPGAVVLGRQPEDGGVGNGPVRVIGGERALLADDRDELRHGRAEAAALVGLTNVRAGSQHGLSVGQLLEGGRHVGRGTQA